jgi:NO-binding membrane sensor protein with MHYT domain
MRISAHRGADAAANPHAGGKATAAAALSQGVAFVVTVHNFSYGLLNPALGYLMSCVGSFLGLRCVTLARAYDGFARARWLSLAAVSIGATGIWAMHFIAMLGFTIPGQQIFYNVPMTVASMLVAVAVVGVGLFIVGFGHGSRSRLVTGGVIVGVGVTAMHYMGMAAMSMADSMSYSLPLLVLSVVIAIVAGTAALWAGTRVSGLRATVGAALIMGVAVSGMHYTGMAALQIHRAAMPSMAAVAGTGGIATVSGTTAAVLLIPLLLVISIATFAVTLSISMAPGEDEIEADAEMQRRMDYLQHRRDWTTQPPTVPAQGRPGPLPGR